MFILPAILQAAMVNKAEDIAPNSSIATIDFSLTGKIKKLLEPFINDALENEFASKQDDDQKAKTQVVIDQLLGGNRFFVSFAAPQSLLFSMPASDSQFETLVSGSEEHEYEGTKVYQMSTGGYSAKIGGLAVLSIDMESLHQAIDRASGKSADSLANDSAYMEFINDYVNPHALSFTIDFQELVKFAEPFVQANLVGDKEKKAVDLFMDIFKALNFEGGSFGETSNGYKFNFKATGDAAKLQEVGLGFAPGGSFTPSLYQKFPGAKPILYSESFNPKAGFAQSKAFLEKIKEAVGENDALDIFAQLKEETGFDLEEVYNAFPKEMAFGVQYDQNSPLPYVTLMGNVSDNKAAGTKLVNDLSKTLADLLKKENVPQKIYEVTAEGGFTKFTFDFAKADDYDGPPFAPIVLTFGVSEDGLLIISNYPDIDDAAKRSGFASDSDFASHMNDETGPNTGIFYLNMRNVWGWLDAMFAWGERAGGGENGPPLDAYQGYYSVLEKVYGWRDLFIVDKADSGKALAEGTVIIDSAKHKTYEQLLEEFKSIDSDGDGVSDHDERHVFFTPIDSGDSDDDGVMDIEELEKGFDPEGEGRLWSDVGEDDYYTDEAASLYQRGAIKGYADGTFQPGKLVNRAEFTTMIVKAFEQGTSNFLGVDIELATKNPPFADLDPMAWYYKPIAKAYAAGFISGGRNPVTGALEFRPGDSITRAEAIAILNKASQALTKTKPQAKCSDSPFKDVGQTDWFCDEVANAYNNGVTKGKAPDAFKPFDQLTRGEAAVMIKRTLEIDLKVISSDTKSFGELTQPLGDRYLPGVGGGLPLF